MSEFVLKFGCVDDDDDDDEKSNMIRDFKSKLNANQNFTGDQCLMIVAQLSAGP